ncbi:nhaD [Symbiodinium microadriaticum]|nr:nhaD [Symbiodinium microadriaticum]
MYLEQIFLLFAQWVIVVVYIYVDSVSTILAGFFLSFGTAGSELLGIAFMESFYTKLVWPRAGNEAAVVWGDQSSNATGLLGLAHAFAEGSRLVSLLCVAARSPTWHWQWFANVILMLITNLAVRHGYHVSACVRVLPRVGRRLKPSCFAILHRHGRLMCGYYRFVAIGSYVLWRILWLGATPLFNTHTLVLFACVLVAEVLEDLVVLRRWLPLDLWRRQLRYDFKPLDPFHPRQGMCKDHRGVHVELPPLRLHGARVLSGPLNAAAMQITCSTVLVLMWLPLGVGFNLGVCPEPILEGQRLGDAFWWSLPWQC